MSILGTFTKQPNEVLDYDIDYTSWLSETDFVVSDITTVDGVGLVIDSSIVINSGTKLKIWLSGGTDGATYKITARVTTSDARVKEDEFRVRIKEF